MVPSEAPEIVLDAAKISFAREVTRRRWRAGRSGGGGGGVFFCFLVIFGVFFFFPLTVVGGFRYMFFVCCLVGLYIFKIK